MGLTTRAYVKELLVPLLPGVTESSVFRAKRVLLDGLVYSLSTLAGGKGTDSIQTPLHKAWTAFSGVGAGGLVGICSLGFFDAVTQLAAEGRYEEASYMGALLVAGRGVLGTGAHAVERYMKTKIGQ